MTEPVQIDISGKAIIRILAVLAAVWLWLQIWQWVLLLVVASFLAVGLDPAVTWLDARGLRRRFAAPLIILAIVAGGGVFVYLAGAALSDQAALLGGRFDAVRAARSSRFRRGCGSCCRAARRGARGSARGCSRPGNRW